MQQKYWLSLLLLLFVPGVVFAQSGKIQGSVVDLKTKEPLIGANIVVEGTNFGAATNVDGTYLIINVPVGTYTLKATYIGYRTITVSNVRVSQDYTTEQNYELPSEDVQVQTVEIVAERPLINKDYTNTIQVKTGEELQALPVRGVSNIVGLQASVVKNEATNALYIRGGRAEETSVLVDGVSVVNALSGQASPAFSNLSQNSIEELQVQTGGFNAEYGSSMSGHINVTTRKATTKYSVGGEVITDAFLAPEVGKSKGWGYNLYNLTLGGPVPMTDDLVTLFISIDREYLGDRDPRAVGGYKPNSSQQSWSINSKLTIKPMKEMDVNVGGLAYLRKGNNWNQDDRFFNWLHNEKFDNSTYSMYGKLTHNIGSNLFYTFQLGYFLEETADGDPVFWNELEAYGMMSRNPYLTSTGTDPRMIYSSVDAYGTVFNRFRRSATSHIEINGDINLQEGLHFLKSGFQYRQYSIRRYNIAGNINGPLKLAVAPGSGAVIDWERYKNCSVQYYGYTYYGKVSDGDDYFGARTEGPKEPVYWAAYIQDKIEMSDLVLNLGVRVDHFDAKEQIVKDPLNPFGAQGTPNGGVFDASDLKSSEAFTTLSPRLGFSFPVTDRAVFHAQFGTFLQMPPLERVLVSKTYEEYIMGQSPYSVQIPNPNLKPERTTSYEVGLRHLVTDNAAISFTGFYKEIKDLIQARNVGTSANPAYPNAYETYENVDFGTTKGFDLIIDLRRSRGFSFSLNYTLSFASGTGSDPTTQGRISWLQSEPPKLIAPLNNDRRHNGSVNVDYRTLENEGPAIGDIYPLENLGINVLTTFNSGVPYTKSNIYNPIFGGTTGIEPVEPINASTTPWNYSINLRIDRSFKIGSVGFVASLYVINLTDAKNVYGVWRPTGEPDNTGWLQSSSGQSWVALPENGPAAAEMYKQASIDPNNYGIPRQFRLGLRVEY